MPSQDDLSAVQQYAFFDNPEEGGRLMTRNVPSTQSQRDVATNRGKRSPFKADVRLVTCVHGKMSEEESTLASLIILEYHVGCTGERYRYNSLDTRLAIRSQMPKDLKDEPFVKAYAPFKLSEVMDPIEVEYTKTGKAEANVGVSFTPANAGITVGRDVEKKYKLNSYAFGHAFEEFTDGKPGTDAILWEMRENKIKGVGVPDTFRVAILVQRANHDKFLVDFSLDLHAGLWFAATETFKSVCGLAEADDPIIFNPSLGPQGETAHVKATNLAQYTDQEKLKTLTPIHLL
ncbi:hypothetical protein OEA41_003225 [Lepraria neglecta]|uniref:Uncharacterized protein n=1 Tax=Lepraria neglecta TaxID=209136 RepID=A0AAD9Z5D6_9LECA|nr:hypothetical protein OEA41_003225 [Lepraria neglecta]